MGVATTVQEYLDSHRAGYRIIQHPNAKSLKQAAEMMHVPGEQMARPVLLGDDINYLLAVIPASHRLDLDRLNQVMARSLEIVDEDEVSMAFRDCDADAIPALGEPYGVDTVVDASLAHQEQVYFEAGDHEHLVQMDGATFRQLMEHVPRVQVSHHL
jgi:Ala-tRNA(Pro) deacylase